MITNAVLQWVLSAVYVLITAYSLYWIVRCPTGRDRISYVTHALMGVAMFAMIWPWGMSLLIVPQIAVFSLATLWFLYLAGRDRGHPEERSAHRGHHGGSGKLIYHAGMMVAMVVMGFSMLGYVTPMSEPMHMSGPASPLWVSVLGAAFALAFAVATVFFVGSSFAAARAPAARTSPGRKRLADGAWNFLMAAGMLALFVSLVNFG
jgi:hypothetical protein